MIQVKNKRLRDFLHDHCKHRRSFKAGHGWVFSFGRIKIGAN